MKFVSCGAFIGFTRKSGLWFVGYDRLYRKFVFEF